MGWFETKHFPDALIGDDPLDLTGRFLEQLREAYLDGPGRLPTVAEFEATLAIVIGSVGGRWFEELDGKQVTKIALKTKNVPKRQPYAVGDIFAIPLTAGDFAFGRYVYDRPKEGGLIEVYHCLRDSPVFDERVLENERMGPLLWVNPRTLLETGECPILRNDPNFEPAGLEELELLGGPPHAYKIVGLDGTVLRSFDGTDLRSWQDRTFSLRDADQVRCAVERWLGRRNEDDELIA